jgi:hypothetical protein
MTGMGHEPSSKLDDCEGSDRGGWGRFGRCRELAVRPEGAKHQWRRNPPRELSIDLVADERLGRVTGRAGAS